MALPCPGFEGSEKRLEVDFSFGLGTPAGGLRTLARPQLDGLLQKVRGGLMHGVLPAACRRHIVCTS